MDKPKCFVITPHPYDHDFDDYCTPDEDEAKDAIETAAEGAWDEINLGDKKTITIELKLCKYVEGTCPADCINAGEDDGPD